ncbi:AAA family ATPase [Candidatus Woesearchaeota archaeon]|nr:AAA family ATPase [Candidatus Woesearchaeota archaeon]
MKLIYIYGPPAVGKWTVAKQLAKITGFRLFHSHLTADYVSFVFPERNEMTNQLKWEIAYKMFEAAARHNVDLIFTMAHENVQNKFVKKLIKKLERYNGKILFVKLSCKEEKLYKRVTSKSRKPFGKIKTAKEMKTVLKRGNKFEAIPFKKSLVIDNTHLSPKKCAEKIKEYYGL